MYFLLHHSTGALILDADDRSQVVSWSERQLGQRAGATSIMELEDELPRDWVEKSGTGIRQAGGCEAKLSYMADSVQRVVGLDHEVIKSFEWHRVVELHSCNSTVH